MGIDLQLPDFAFLEGYGSENILEGRTVILHTRSASVIEIVNPKDVILNPDVVYYKFRNKILQFGIDEKLLAVLHYSATLRVPEDSPMLIEQVLIPAAKWYCNYADWEDKNIWGPTEKKS